jgi:hypothetical protein
MYNRIHEAITNIIVVNSRIVLIIGFLDMVILIMLLSMLVLFLMISREDIDLDSLNSL